jgi:hypothetical protein
MSLSTDKRLNNLTEAIKDEPKIAVGTGQSQINPTDSDLQNEVLRKDAESESLGTGRVLKTITLSPSDAVGELIGEAGTVDSEGDVVSQVVFSPENKSDDEEFIIEIEDRVVNQ